MCLAIPRWHFVLICLVSIYGTRGATDTRYHIGVQSLFLSSSLRHSDVWRGCSSICYINCCLFLSGRRKPINFSATWMDVVLRMYKILVIYDYYSTERGMWRVWGRGEVCTGFWWGNLRERDHWGDPDVDGRIILRWTFRKCEGVVGTGWSWLRIGTGGGHLWVRWGTFGFQKCGVFLD